MAAPISSAIIPPMPASRGKHALVVWSAIMGIVLTALGGTYMLFVEAPPPRRIIIAAGPKNGAYYRFADAYARELQQDGLTVDVRETAGSVENLQLLNDEGAGVTVAMVQSGVAGVEDRDRYHALASLYREPLWVFHRRAVPLERISQLAGRRIGVGPPGSGTHAIAMQLLAANEVGESDGSVKGVRTVVVKESVTSAARALLQGELDAAFFVAAFDADYIQQLLKDDRVRLMSFGQHLAYHRRFRFLSEVTLPAGLVSLGHNLPACDVPLIAPTAMLVTRKNVHPALVPLFLTAATRIHSKGDALSGPGEFPSAAYTDFALSEDAEHFFKSGPPMLQRLLPFWVASLVDRLKVMLIPLVMLLMPLLRAAPPLVRWRTRRKIYLWYSALRQIDQKLTAGLSGPGLDIELERLRDLEHQVSCVEVPLSYADDLYHLRLHLRMVEETLRNRRYGMARAKAA
jgi:TRAP transporter TAXI family solute receptor